MAAVVVVLLTGMIAEGQPAAAAESEATDLRPNAERPLTHEELLMIRGERERSATWGSAMLVAETVLERDRPLRGGDQWSGEGPAFGALPRDEVHPGDPLVLASRTVTARLPADDGPVRGLLAISDSRSDALRLQGTVEMPAGTYLTPVETSAIADADALPGGALIVVRGWLSSLPSSEACPEVPSALDPHDTGGRDSPFVRCPGGWLTAGEVVELDPDDPTSPLAFGIPVQSGALERYGRQKDEQPVPGPASFLLRHVVNPIDGATSARAWLVIGRLGPINVPDVTPPADRADIARPGGLDWQPGMDRQPPADGWSLDSTAWDGGFASVHLGRDRVMSSWVSSDGRSWEGTELPTGIATVSALLPLRDGLVLIANELRFDEPWTYEVWEILRRPVLASRVAPAGPAAGPLRRLPAERPGLLVIGRPDRGARDVHDHTLLWPIVRLDRRRERPTRVRRHLRLDQLERQALEAAAHARHSQGHGGLVRLSRHPGRRRTARALGRGGPDDRAHDRRGPLADDRRSSRRVRRLLAVTAGPDR